MSLSKSLREMLRFTQHDTSEVFVALLYPCFPLTSVPSGVDLKVRSAT